MFEFLKRISTLETHLEWMNQSLFKQRVFGILYHDRLYQPYPSVKEINIPRLEKMIEALLEYHNLEWQVLEERQGYNDEEKGCLIERAPRKE